MSAASGIVAPVGIASKLKEVTLFIEAVIPSSNKVNALPVVPRSKADSAKRNLVLAAFQIGWIPAPFAPSEAAAGVPSLSSYFPPAGYKPQVDILSVSGGPPAASP